MCQECKSRWDALDEDLKREVLVPSLGSGQAIVDTLKGKLNHIEFAVAAGLMSKITTAQLDEDLRAVVDDMVARGFEITKSLYAQQGKNLAPRPHRPMEFREAPVRPSLRATEERPAREPGGGMRRVTRVRH